MKMLAAIFVACVALNVNASPEECSSHNDEWTCNMGACHWRTKCTASQKNSWCAEATSEDACNLEGCKWATNVGQGPGCHDPVAHYCASLGDSCPDDAALFCQTDGMCMSTSRAWPDEKKNMVKESLDHFKKSEIKRKTAEGSFAQKDWGVHSAKANWDFNAKQDATFLRSNVTPPSPDTAFTYQLSLFSLTFSLGLMIIATVA